MEKSSDPLVLGVCPCMGPSSKRACPSSIAGADGKPTGQSHGEGNGTGVADARRHERGRGEHRRHTITNGVDYGMVGEQFWPGYPATVTPARSSCND